MAQTLIWHFAWHDKDWCGHLQQYLLALYQAILPVQNDFDSNFPLDSPPNTLKKSLQRAEEEEFQHYLVAMDERRPHLL